MTDPRYTKLAKLLVYYSTALKRGDRVFLDMIDVPDDFCIELMRVAREAGALPIVEVRHTRITRELLRDTNQKHAELIRDQLIAAYPAGAVRFRANTTAYIALLNRLNTAVQTAIDTIPPKNRVLLTYHDSFAYFAKHYGMKVIGAIQPSDFAEPSAQEVAALEKQIKDEHVPAIFGSEVFPSTVLAQIGRDTGAKYEATLRDDDLPGNVGGPDHSYVGLMVYDVRTMVTDLGGNPSALDGIPTHSAYD